ncbi:hypothetical protein A3L09_10605 (plasmid) [Thermococcus profundus]|uniref:Uncharacterized protein n=1 Tax=Thermococcus profundus TaxID=49899 RepID=A0A2Z2MN34_THEPR|nr:hypothetical protein [Thermococcus profundus]ASJ03801.1 hypothetical protein A3L09_10605 [Thermococcus profundus]
MTELNPIFEGRLLDALKHGEWCLSADGEYLVVPVRAISNSKAETSSFIEIIEVLGLGRYGVTTRKGVGSFRAFFIKISALRSVSEEFSELFKKELSRRKLGGSCPLMASSPGRGGDSNERH